MKVKYNAANIGDLLKHSWLIEVTGFLSKQFPSDTFKYADAFCGFKEYEIEDFFKDRLTNQFQKTKLYELQKDCLEKKQVFGQCRNSREATGGQG